MNTFTKVVLALVIIGAINWGLVGFFNWNLVDAIFGGTVQTNSNWFSRIIYSLVGLGGIYMAVVWPRLRESYEKRAAVARRAEV